MWQLALSDRAGALIGDISDAHDRQLNFGLSTMNTVSFTVRGDHPLADTLIDGDALVKVYRKSGSFTSVLMMVCEIVTVEEIASDADASIAVTCAEACYFRLQRRLIGLDSAGVTYGTAASPMARHTAAISARNAANTAYATGVAVDAGCTSTGTMVAGPYYFKPVMEAITDAAFASDGFDFVFDPLEPSTGNVGSFRCATTIGTSRPEAIFEYGTGKNNVLSFKRQVTRDTLCNKAYVSPPGFPDNTADSVTVSSDATSIAARGWFQAAIPADLSTSLARQSIADLHVTLRKNARQRIEFVPGGTAPQFVTDFGIGDTVTARAEHPANSIRFNATFRVYGVAVKLNDEGFETVSLTLIGD